MKRALAALAFAGAWTAFGVTSASAMSPAEAQVVFARAQAAMSAGQVDAAISDLTKLDGGASTPRVKLELARLLLLKGESGESLRLFREVYDAEGTPPSVKRNILPLMEKAELRVFRLRHGIRLATDSNPSRTSEGGTIYFNGVPFEYQPPHERKAAFGIEPYVSAEKMWSNGTLGRAQASARLFEDTDLMSGSLHASVGAPIPGLDFSMATLGVDTRIGKNSSYALPSIDFWKRFRPAEGFDFGLGGQVGYFISSNDDVSGGYYRPYAFARMPFVMDTSAFARVSVEHLNSRNDFYTYYTPKIEVGIDIEAGGLSATPKLELSKSFYAQYDPFWGVDRVDTTVKPSITLSHEKFSYKGFAPELTFSYETRSSNIFIHEYEQFGGSVNLKRIF